jgi:hypothetical protein
MVLCYNDVAKVCCIKFVLFTGTALPMTTSVMKSSISPGVQILLQWKVMIRLDSGVIPSSSFLFVGISCLYVSQYWIASPKIQSQNAYSPVECHKKNYIYISHKPSQRHALIRRNSEVIIVGTHTQKSRTIIYFHSSTAKSQVRYIYWANAWQKWHADLSMNKTPLSSPWPKHCLSEVVFGGSWGCTY